MKAIAATWTFLVCLTAGAYAADTEPLSASPPGAAVYIISPAHGEQVTSPVVVRFGLRGMGVAPAGVEQENTGHHHLLVDRDLPPPGEPMPTEPGLKHFGGGQTETKLDLEPGKHRLQLILGDHYHIPHDPPVVSDPITIVVEQAK